ncbi:MAG: 30S ribosomal protein S26e [Candidatus Odinarchaeota archaeon]
MTHRDERSLPSKRKSGGRSKGSTGRGATVQCSQCGKVVPRDKAKKRTSRASFVDPQMARELRRSGTFLPSRSVTKWFCISCAVHRGVVTIRSRKDRKGR